MPSWKRILIASLALPAFLLGVLAVHALSTETPASAQVSVTAQALTEPAADATMAMCDAQCGAVHHLIAATCVFGMILVLFLLLPATVPALGAAARRLSHALARPRGRLPSLPLSPELLSVSRI